MIDLATLLFSTIMVLYVLVRAAILDNELGWFGTRPKAQGRELSRREARSTKEARRLRK